MESKDRLIRVHFWKGDGLIGRIIRRFTWSDYSHVGMELNGWMYEAREFRGVVKQRWPDSKRSSSAVLELRISQSDLRKLAEWWECRIGLPYDYWQVVRFIYRKDETASTKPKYFCSEALVDSLAYIGINLFERVPSYKISPGWVYRSPLFKGETNE